MDEMLLTAMQYPKTVSLKDSNPLLKTYYSCKQGSCDFTKAKQEINDDVELRAFGALDAAKSFIEQIEKNPLDFLPARFDGYHMTVHGFDILRLQRKDDGVEANSGRIGFVEYGSLRGSN